MQRTTTTQLESSCSSLHSSAPTDPWRCCSMQVKFKQYLDRFAHFETTESLAQVRE